MRFAGPCDPTLALPSEEAITFEVGRLASPVTILMGAGADFKGESLVNAVTET